jgi:hypothetical protein
MLEEAFATFRKQVKPRFPYDAKTKGIRLPHDIEEELRHVVLTGKKVEAFKRVTELTGAGLRVSKDYVDHLVKERERSTVQPRPEGTGVAVCTREVHCISSSPVQPFARQALKDA